MLLPIARQVVFEQGARELRLGEDHHRDGTGDEAKSTYQAAC